MAIEVRTEQLCHVFPQADEAEVDGGFLRIIVAGRMVAGFAPGHWMMWERLEEPAPLATSPVDPQSQASADNNDPNKAFRARIGEVE